MKKKLISLFLSLVLSIQLLPLSQIVTSLYQSQLTEELPHTDKTGNLANPFVEEIHKQFVHSTHEHLLQLSETRVLELIHHAEKMYTRFSDDVQTQPPNDRQTA
jgi:hypothetical protein